ncbi:Uncharacterized protein PECH_005663 [Penicillium ucsense]|uniref:Stress-response A/B barrel domain-containing protein n=1 Tax=Penicillium ucsense TaxID=2839758 RepID=A0A8J8W5Q6_9EURO|nr:Uncharacterized protein PECM_002879 [Penicillium ucsense]KAF7739250.1 Uncharacterized protein PECH_005663 [Penicillium ucsense]
MTIVHIGMLEPPRLPHLKPTLSPNPSPWNRKVLFKFRPEAQISTREKFVTELKTLKYLACVKDQRLIVGGPSITDPASKSKGFQYALVSYHDDREALDMYQASPEHARVTSQYFIPYQEDLVRFDFEADLGGEDLLGLSTSSHGV